VNLGLFGVRHPGGLWASSRGGMCTLRWNRDNAGTGKSETSRAGLLTKREIGRGGGGMMQPARKNGPKLLVLTRTRWNMGTVHYERAPTPGSLGKRLFRHLLREERYVARRERGRGGKHLEKACSSTQGLNMLNCDQQGGGRKKEIDWNNRCQEPKKRKDCAK